MEKGFRIVCVETLLEEGQSTFPASTTLEERRPIEFLDTHLVEHILVFADFVKSLATTRTNQPTNKQTNNWVNINYNNIEYPKRAIKLTLLWTKET